MLPCSWCHHRINITVATGTTAKLNTIQDQLSRREVRRTKSNRQVNRERFFGHKGPSTVSHAVDTDEHHKDEDKYRGREIQLSRPGKRWGLVTGPEPPKKCLQSSSTPYKSPRLPHPCQS
ncbi:hypothetical protein PtA15_8A759 [Puccinia triticina]|uniref:Uncharacterized protein n=1 Tax=Puccinia triticina TaxID=208348 RepID=A0ABY7CYQ9_9BASI|nr:uncharacterized protein PtA15_8A759 [Puccinia triticina]WAQ87852.1 hypothetical protein PtA15_8A759 [Puccinia triticina]